MLVGAATTLFKMRKNLAKGLGRAIKDLKSSAGASEATGRLDRDMNMRVVFGGLAVAFLAMIAVYFWFSGNVAAAVVAAIVMAITGFFFAAVSGNLVGMIGSSNNPISGLTLSTLLIAALLMVAIGVEGTSGVAAVLGVAAVVCISSAVAGEMLQDLKVGHILGGTPARMQWGDILGIVIAGAVMFFPLLILHQANITAGGTGFGDPKLSAPQAGLMAAIAQGVVGGQMAWPLIIVGILMGLGFVLLKVRSPMLVSVGMYLPLETTFAIFCGGVIRWLADKIAARRKLNAAQRTRTDNAGVLVASGLIAGEALMGLGIAAYVFFANKDFPGVEIGSAAHWIAPLILVVLAVYMIARPLQRAGAADEPPPPSAVM
jgi:putative OPT family oligopeptide transporter